MVHFVSSRQVAAYLILIRIIYNLARIWSTANWQSDLRQRLEYRVYFFVLLACVRHRIPILQAALALPLVIAAVGSSLFSYKEKNYFQTTQKDG